MLVLLLLPFLLLAPNGGNADIPPLRLLSITEMRNPAFTQVLHNSVSDQLDLVTSTFNPIPFSLDNVYIIRDLANKVYSMPSQVHPTDVLTDEFPWPNEFEEVPSKYLNLWRGYCTLTKIWNVFCSYLKLSTYFWRKMYASNSKLSKKLFLKKKH